MKPNCQINALYQNKKLPKTVHDVLSVNKAVMIEQDEKNKPAFLSIVECFIVSSIQVMQLGNLAKIGLKLAPDHTDLLDRTRFVKHCHNGGGVIS